MRMVEPNAGNRRVASTEIPEELLIQRVLAGETDLYGVLAERHGRRVYRRIRMLVKNDMDAEDILQDTHLRALTYLHQFGGRAKFVTWLSRVAANAALNHLRQRQRLEQRINGIFEQSATASTLAFGFRDPETCVRDIELREGLRRAVAELPHRYRDVFLLKEVGHLKTLEIARRLRIRSDNVRVKLYRARRMLRATVGEYHR